MATLTEAIRLANTVPDLLAAAKEALELLDKQREEYNNGISLLPRHHPTGEGPIASKLRAAIAKVEGENDGIPRTQAG